MSKDIIVLAPNGRRHKVHCNPNTVMMQVLEDVCEKQGFQPSDYDLKHHNHVLDLTTSIRFSNLPNKATLEMVEAERRRVEQNVTIGLQLEDGERRTAEFPPNTKLYDLLTSLAPEEVKCLQHPTVMYMRQEVVGLPALRERTLRHLGLTGGRAVLRLLDKADEPKQANVSSVYRAPPPPAKPDERKKEHADNKIQPPGIGQTATAGPSKVPKTDNKPFDPLALIKEEKKKPKDEQQVASKTQKESTAKKEVVLRIDSPMEVDSGNSGQGSSTNLLTQENLERRLNIEEEVTFLGAKKAIAFIQPEESQEEIDDFPDDFYDLTLDEVRKLYKDLQQQRLELENTPLLPAEKREQIEKMTSQQKLAQYKNVVVRVQFPDHMILQGVFSPSDTIEDVTKFVKEHLRSPNKPFHIFTTPLKETLDPKTTLLEAKFVPCVHMHFRWLEDDDGGHCLKENVYSKTTSSSAASILASKYRSRSRRKPEEASQDNNKPTTSKANTSKAPKWFKN